jgi:hypothetical protein
MGVSAVRLFVAGLLAPLMLGLAAPAAAQPPPSAPAAPAGPRCDALLENGKLLALNVPTLRQIIAQAPLLAENSSASFVIREPVATAEAVAFRAFIKEASGWRPLAVEEVRGQPDADTVKDLGLDQPASWSQILIHGPERNGIGPGLRERVELTFVACAADGTVLASGTTRTSVSAALLSKFISFLVVAFLYFAFATIVWLTRNRLSQEKGVQAPLRWQCIEPYSWWRCCDPVVMTSDSFDRGSLSKLQVLVFTLVVLYELCEILLRTGILSDVSTTIIYLLGIPAVGSIGTQLTTLNRDRLSSSNWAWLTSRGILPMNDPGTGTPSWSDLFMTDGELDLYKAQAGAFSALVVISMLQTGMTGFREFSVPESLLQILGLSQLVLVGGRFTKPATMGDLDKLVSELKVREQTLRRAAATGIDVDPEGKPVSPPPPAAAKAPFKTLNQAAAVTAVPNAAARYLDLAKEVEILLDGLVERHVDRTRLLSPSL